MDEVLAEFTQLKTLGKLVGAYDLKRQRFLRPAAGEKPPLAVHSNGADTSNGTAHAGPGAVVERFEVAAVATPLDADAREKKIPQRPHPGDRG